MDFTFAQIRQLLEQALTPEDFNDLVFDNFNCLHEKFTGVPLPERRRGLIEYANKHRKIPDLLDCIKQINKTVYDEFQDKLTQSEIPSLSNLKETILDGELIDKLGEILLKEDDFFWQCTKYVYQDFLLYTDTESESLEEIYDLDDLLWQLKDKTDELVILEFVARLVAYISVKYREEYQAILKILKSWTRQNILELKINRSDYENALQRFNSEYRRSYNQAYLMIAIAEKSAYPNFFQISGWLATDAILSNPDLNLIPLEIQKLGVAINGAESQEGLYTIAEGVTKTSKT